MPCEAELPANDPLLPFTSVHPVRQLVSLRAKRIGAVYDRCFRIAARSLSIIPSNDDFRRMLLNWER